MTTFRRTGRDDDNEDLVEIMTRIAMDLERVITGIFSCAGLLAFIACLLLLRLLIGR